MMQTLVIINSITLFAWIDSSSGNKLFGQPETQQTDFDPVENQSPRGTSPIDPLLKLLLKSFPSDVYVTRYHESMQGLSNMSKILKNEELSAEEEKAEQELSRKQLEEQNLLNVYNSITNPKSCEMNQFRCESINSPLALSWTSSSSIHLPPHLAALFPQLEKIQQEIKCISKEHVCDRVKDCPNREDESELRCRCWQEPNHFKCKGMDVKKCIPNEWICDGVKDCPYGDDEDKINCLTEDRNSNEYRCLGPFSHPDSKTQIIVPLSSSRQVIPVTWKCDGEQDCDKGDDEKFCTPAYPGLKSVAPANTNSSSSTSTASTRNSTSCYKCQGLTIHGSDCIQTHRLCDGILDCPLGDDEDKCSDTTMSVPEPEALNNGSFVEAEI